MRFTKLEQGLQLIKQNWFYLFAILIGLVIGGILMFATMRAKDAENRKELLQTLQAIEKALDWRGVEKQSLQQVSLKTPEWREFKSKIQGVCSFVPDCQWIYIMHNDDQDNLKTIITSESDEESLPPNTIYAEATPAFKLHFKTHKNIVQGPVLDSDGLWTVGAIITHSVPNLDGRYISIGLDIEAKNWRQSVYLAALLPLIATLVYLALIAYLLFRNFRGQQDNSRLRDKANQLFIGASYDQLTGLVNRSLFEDRLKQECHIANREPSSLAVLFMDLDGFKQVNDTHGHSVGDEVLKVMATKMASLVRAEDTLARFGGDEFVLMLPRIEDKQQVLRVAQKILVAVQERLVINGAKFELGVSIGYAIYPHEKSDVDQLIKAADEAMYLAKKQGKNQVKSYSDVLASKDQMPITIQK